MCALRPAAHAWTAGAGEMLLLATPLLPPGLPCPPPLQFIDSFFSPLCERRHKLAVASSTIADGSRAGAARSAPGAATKLRRCCRRTASVPLRCHADKYLFGFEVFGLGFITTLLFVLATGARGPRMPPGLSLQLQLSLRLQPPTAAAAAVAAPSTPSRHFLSETLIRPGAAAASAAFCQLILTPPPPKRCFCLHLVGAALCVPGRGHRAQGVRPGCVRAEERVTEIVWRRVSAAGRSSGGPSSGASAHRHCARATLVALGPPPCRCPLLNTCTPRPNRCRRRSTPIVRPARASGGPRGALSCPSLAPQLASSAAAWTAPCR